MNELNRPLDEQGVIDALLAALRAGAPVGWARVRLDVWANVTAYEIAASAQDSHGRFAGEVRLPEVTRELVALRDEMYEPARGAWLSARFVVNREGEPEVSFNYDDDPQWSPQLQPGQFVRDLEAYPRAEDRVPQWMRDVVARAEPGGN
ncbi:hypothetical protein Lesp02_16390 [Lentzea sp. NBRC 105346]|uniref:hypothetical protein n=1 Tax=Lentzea sp. NBRC 105346 TaxID=3032205 RepID=UPI0024A456BD|nr:hypothetical protein [Lentzea sp. NBRC 105346]GLZ29449.1 hypothetical protein Lesp02_16390 [Lentzea sp. NBRC 105346]